MIPTKAQRDALAEALAAEDERDRAASIVMEAEARLASKRRDLDAAQSKVVLARRKMREVAAEIAGAPLDHVDITG